MSPTSQIANCMVPSADEPGLSSPRPVPYPLPSLPSGFPPLPLPAPRLVSNRSWVLRRLSAAQLLQSALPSSSPPKRRTIYDTFIPPDGKKKNCCTIAVSAERRDQCQVRFPLAIPRTPRHPERRTTPLQAAEPMVGQRVRRDHRTCGSRTG